MALSAACAQLKQCCHNSSSSSSRRRPVPTSPNMDFSMLPRLPPLLTRTSHLLLARLLGAVGVQLGSSTLLLVATCDSSSSSSSVHQGVPHRAFCPGSEAVQLRRNYRVSPQLHAISTHRCSLACQNVRHDCGTDAAAGGNEDFRRTRWKGEQGGGQCGQEKSMRLLFVLPFDW